MAILEEEVWITIVGSNYKYFESKGYEIPKVNFGEKILVKTVDLNHSSNVKVTKICDKCENKILNQVYSNIMKQRKNGVDICSKCNRMQSWETRYNSTPYEKTLEGYAKQTNKLYLIQEYSDKNKLQANQIPYGSNKDCLWGCPKCKNEYSMEVVERSVANFNCPYCSGRRVLKGFNDLHTTHPDISKYLTDQSIGYEINAGSNKKLSFTCDECGHNTEKTIAYLASRGNFNCPKCSDGISYPEKFMMNLLDQLDIKFETQKLFQWSQNKLYDFYIPSLNCIIETHGIQHYLESFKFNEKGITLKDTQANDMLKEGLARNNGVDNYISINCSISNLDFIKERILKCEMSEFLALESVDWLKCHEFACRSMVKTVCELWNSSANTLEIAKRLKVSRVTIIRYLHQGEKLGWCKYDTKEIMKNNGKINSQSNNRGVVQLDLVGNFIKEWSSIGEAQKELNINNVSAACRGVRKKAGGFKWMYAEEYFEENNGKINIK